MIDTHAHLDFPDFDQDREEVISRFFVTGGMAIINVGVDLERSRKSIEISEKHEGIFASVGLHPDFYTKHTTHNTKQDCIEELRKLAKNKKVVAVGETGLDYFRETRNPVPKQSLVRGEREIEDAVNKFKELQKKGFIAQINLAQELNLPVIVHCREAWDDVFDIVSQKSKVKSQNYNSKVESIETKFVLHCYSGGKKDTEKFLKLTNIYFSFSGNITYPKPVERAEKLAEAVKMVPLDRIMLDSDAPFLAPQSRRGKRNEPIFIKYIAKKIAEIKEISEKEVERKTDENAREFFVI